MLTFIIIIYLKHIAMKKLILISTVALATGMLMGCGENTQKDSKAFADSTNKAKDSSKNDTATTSAAGLTVSKDNAEFAVAAANGGMAEVELGKLAQEKASRQVVRDFGAMMVKDHSKANGEMKAIAKSKNITLPPTLGADEQKVKDKLSAKSGSEFDKAYVDDMVEDHKKDVKEFEDAGNKLTDPALKAFAVKTLPILKMHLAAIQKIQDQIK
jgi:putative membrane protein